MFGDGGWDSSQSDAQHRRLNNWLRTLDPARTAIVELGAGMHVPTIRIMSEDFAERPGGTLIRINPRELDIPAGHLAIPMGALAALRAIDDRLDAIANGSNREGSFEHGIHGVHGKKTRCRSAADPGQSAPRTGERSSLNWILIPSVYSVIRVQIIPV